MKYLGRGLVLAHVFFFTFLESVWAQSVSSGDDPNSVVQTYSEQMIEIMKGPIARILSFVILLACVGSLLRGRHKLAISCGLAFILLLFIQVI